MDLSASADDKCRAHTLVAVELLNLFRYVSRHLIYQRLGKLPHLFCLNRMLQTHNVFKLDLIIYRSRQLDMLRHPKINEVMLYQHFRQLVSGKRDHAVGNNAAVPCQ